MRLFLRLATLILLKVVLGSDQEPMEAPAQEEDPSPGTNEEKAGLVQTDTSDLVWEEPITEAEMERGRGIAGEHPSNGTMALVRAGLESERSRDERAIMRELSARWPNNIVPYRIESTFTSEHRAVIASGFSNIEDNTCIKFRAVTATDEDWVEIFSTGATGCFANTRYYGPGYGKHEIGLDIGDSSKTCVTKGVVVHELLHIIGVAHEQQRPDRDSYVTMDWANIQAAMANNMFKDSWDTEDVDSLKKCNNKGVTTVSAYYGDCVSGNTVTDFGVGYDFKSVMHYGLKSFAVDSSKWVMYPKDNSIGEDDVGGEELSAMDIKKLNYAHYCDGTTKVKCGGSYYSPTGGDIDGNPLAGSSSCEFLFTTDDGKGVELNLNINFVGSCSDDYLEVRVGGMKGPLIGKYCKDNAVPAALKVPTTALWMVWKKSSPGASMTGTWKAYSISCCDTMILDIPERNDFTGTWTKIKGVVNDGRNVYSNGNDRFIAWNNKNKNWGIVPEYPSNRYYGRNKINFFCPNDLKSGWEYYDGSKYVESPKGLARCSDCDLYPQYDECALCCDKVTAVTENAFIKSNTKTLGDYSLYTSVPEYNGKKVYSQDSNPSRCLKAKSNGQWMIGPCTDIASESGWAFGDNAKCARQSSGWQVVVNGAFQSDPTFKFTCANPPTRKPIASTTKSALETTKKPIASTTKSALETTKKPIAVTTKTAIETTKKPIYTTMPGLKTTPTLCPECKTIYTGEMKGVYQLKSYGDNRCDDGCVYYKENKLYCFEAGDIEVALQCPAPSFF